MPQICKVKLISKSPAGLGRLATGGLKAGSPVNLTKLRFELEGDEQYAPYVKQFTMEAVVGPGVAGAVTVGQLFDLAITAV